MTASVRARAWPAPASLRGNISFCASFYGWLEVMESTTAIWAQGFEIGVENMREELPLPRRVWDQGADADGRGRVIGVGHRRCYEES